MNKGNKQTKKWKEYKFKIEAYTPDNLPMAKCASYLAELSNILGETDHVHFVKVAPGCVQLVHKIDVNNEPKIEKNVKAVAEGRGTDVQMKAYHQLRKMLNEDKTTGMLQRGKNNVLTFPVIETEEVEEFNSIYQAGEISGRIFMVGGMGEAVPIHLESEGKKIAGCFADRRIAKELGKYLFEPVRLFGKGKWNRDQKGIWSLDRFEINNFETLKEISLSETIATLRKIKGEWTKDSLYEILDSRHETEEMN